MLRFLSFLILLISINLELNAQIRNAPLTRNDMESAAQNYQKYCALCHGKDRQGNAADYAPSLRSNSLMSTMTLNFLASSIAFGRANTPMAAYVKDYGGPLNMKEIFTLASWLKYESGAETIDLGDGAITGDLWNGAYLYAQECIKCHGKKGEGITAPALANASFLAFATDEYIKYAIVNGRDGSKMNGFKEILTEKETNDITAYIRSLASGWSKEPKKLVPYPGPENYVLNPNGKDPSFHLIDGRYAPMKEVMEAIQNKNKMIILDTRTSSEWHNAHIPGAVPIPYYVEEKDVDKGLTDKSTWIIAYCACPHAASDTVIDMLRKKGYKNTAVINEGFFGWINAGYPISAGEVNDPEN